MTELIDTLRAQGYEEMGRYSFRELIIPLREGLKARNRYARLLWLFFLLGVAAILLYWFSTDAFAFLPFCGWLLAGIPATFLLVPLHEMIHGWMFRRYGAKDVRYGVIWRYFMFYAVAHAFVVGYRQFRYIAMAPFVVISLLCVIGFWWVPANGKVLLLGLYSFHTLCCAGDFGLCAYFEKYRHRQPVSFDDADAGISYFYALPDPDRVLDTENP